MRQRALYRVWLSNAKSAPRDDIFFGRVLGVKESITFHGETVAELHADFTAAI